MSFPLLRFTTFLAPNMLPVYSHMVEWIGRRIGARATLCVGSCYDELSNGIDAAFVCGLAYIEMVRQSRADLEPLAAPLLIGERFSGRPTYYSDVVVHQDSPFRRFSDL